MSSASWARNHHTLATLALVATTAVWGGTFVVVQDAVEQMPVLPFLFWRFALAALVLGALRPGAVGRLDPVKRRHGIWLGLLLGSGYVLQTFGLLHTSATVSGFITGMFVVFTPLIGWVVLRQPISPAVWVAVGLATLGLAPDQPHRRLVGSASCSPLAARRCSPATSSASASGRPPADAYGLTVLQLGVVALMCLLASPLQGGMALPPSPRCGRLSCSWRSRPRRWRSWPRPGRRRT